MALQRITPGEPRYPFFFHLLNRRTGPSPSPASPRPRPRMPRPRPTGPHRPPPSPTLPNPHQHRLDLNHITPRRTAPHTSHSSYVDQAQLRSGVVSGLEPHVDALCELVRSESSEVQVCAFSCVRSYLHSRTTATAGGAAAAGGGGAGGAGDGAAAELSDDDVEVVSGPKAQQGASEDAEEEEVGGVSAEADAFSRKCLPPALWRLVTDVVGGNEDDDVLGTLLSWALLCDVVDAVFKKGDKKEVSVE